MDIAEGKIDRLSADTLAAVAVRRTTLLLSAFVLAIPLGFAIVSAQAAESANIIQPDALTWAPAKGVPPGAQVAVLYGNPSKKGPFAIRFKFPSGYESELAASSLF